MSPMLSCCGRLDRVETRIGDQINQVSYGIPSSALPSATSMKMCSCYNFAWLFELFSRDPFSLDTVSAFHKELLAYFDLWH